MTCYYCGMSCSDRHWLKIDIGKVSVLAAVCKSCARDAA